MRPPGRTRVLGRSRRREAAAGRVGARVPALGRGEPAVGDHGGHPSARPGALRDVGARARSAPPTWPSAGWCRCTRRPIRGPQTRFQASNATRPGAQWPARPATRWNNSWRSMPRTTTQTRRRYAEQLPPTLKNSRPAAAQAQAASARPDPLFSCQNASPCAGVRPLECASR